jgi:hypothetical protein
MLVFSRGRPVIPDFVLPSARDLITDCWVQEPDERPSFEEIVDRLVNMKFKLIRNVNSPKIMAFVKEIDEWEARNSTVLEQRLPQFDCLSNMVPELKLNPVISKK